MAGPGEHEPAAPDQPHGLAAFARCGGRGCRSGTWRVLWWKWSSGWTSRSLKSPTVGRARSRTTRRCCGGRWCTGMRGGCSRAGDRRRAGLSPQRGQRASRSRHDCVFPQALPEAHRAAASRGAEVARAMGMLKTGTVALAGTKVHANASRHSVLSYGYAEKLEKRLKKHVEQLPAPADQADAADVPDGMSIPRRTRAARGASCGDRRGYGECRSASCRAGAGRLSSEARRASGEGAAHRSEARRAATGTAERRGRCPGADQPHGR